jgi:G6PDH family F420-dependent oxidoreductase
VELGIFLSSEEHDGPTLVQMARWADEAGFRHVSISDHFHPWLPEQGESPFVWSVLGAIAEATSDVVVTTGVTCPTVRTHPTIVAHATATTQQLLGGRFRFGIGSGEALNEHIAGARWPAIEVRLEILEEAMDVITRLWTGETVDHHGRHYTVENARLWTLPDQPPQVVMSAFGPKAVALAARIADGYYGAWPARGLLERYRDHGGSGPAIGELKVCYDEDRDRAVETAHRYWRHELVPGQASQDLPTTSHFADIAGATTLDDARERWVCGPDPEEHLAAVQAFVDAGFDEVHVLQIGPRQREAITFYAEEIVPQLA